ncbi:MULTISPECIES: NADH-quinone oxidoreductase subunit J [Acidianus]|uniref:NADH dehydrogenase n=1 Tax=Candidatus Acidianus copahuensis TaxID=1160895 RepID=A0A031LPH5_9CREN|nr:MULTISPECIES: NADH-quinone oxidoreductase subunit J [Acidianus]EZQ06982.1 NADH dehydrogenase [Candidatus Acidianus copahuensis]NON61990.1 NADH-quinone oxidoreductase subunit J [Acidianus sp. RZ1]
MYQIAEALQLTLFSIFAISSVAASIFIVSSKNVFYSAISLAILGISIAADIALLDPSSYSIYSVFHVLLYVGATVVFLSVSLVMFRGLDVREVRISWAPVVSLIVVAFVFVAVLASLSNVPPVEPKPVNLVVLAQDVLNTYWFPAFILIVGLLTTLVEAIALARRE